MLIYLRCLAHSYLIITPWICSVYGNWSDCILFWNIVELQEVSNFSIFKINYEKVWHMKCTSNYCLFHLFNIFSEYEAYFMQALACLWLVRQNIINIFWINLPLSSTTYCSYTSFNPITYGGEGGGGSFKTRCYKKWSSDNLDFSLIWSKIIRRQQQFNFSGAL